LVVLTKKAILLAIESTALMKMPMPPCLIPTPNVHCPTKPKLLATNPPPPLLKEESYTITTCSLN
jgi:hypothetical protein